MVRAGLYYFAVHLVALEVASVHPPRCTHQCACEPIIEPIIAHIIIRLGNISNSLRLRCMNCICKEQTTGNRNHGETLGSKCASPTPSLTPFLNAPSYTLPSAPVNDPLPCLAVGGRGHVQLCVTAARKHTRARRRDPREKLIRMKLRTRCRPYTAVRVCCSMMPCCGYGKVHVGCGTCASVRYGVHCAGEACCVRANLLLSFHLPTCTDASAYVQLPIPSFLPSW